MLDVMMRVFREQLRNRANNLQLFRYSHKPGFGMERCRMLYGPTGEMITLIFNKRARKFSLVALGLARKEDQSEMYIPLAVHTFMGRKQQQELYEVNGLHVSASARIVAKSIYDRMKELTANIPMAPERVHG